jgi:6-phosphogluconolactonase
LAPEAIRAERSAFNVLAGSYAPAGATGVRGFRFAPDPGEFRPVAGRDGVPFPAYLARSAATGCYYAVSETTAQPVPGPGTRPAQTGQPGTIWVLGPEPASSDPGVPARALATGGDLPTHIAAHPSGRWLSVSNYGSHPSSGSVSIVRLHRDGSLAEVADRHAHAGHGPVVSRQDCAHVHSTAFNSAGDRLIAADLGADALVVYDFDARDGRLSAVSAARTPPGWGPRYMLWGPGGHTLLVVGELASEIGVFAFDGNTIELIRHVPTVRRPRDGVLPADLRFSPDGRRIYVSNRGAVNSIATFDSTRPDQMELIGEAPSGGVWPRHLAVTPDGRYLVVANEHSGRLTALAIDSEGAAAAPLVSAEMPGVSYVEVEAA